MKRFAALVVAAACTSGHTTDIQPTLRFADHGDPEVQRLIAAARGADVIAAYASLAVTSDPCPMTTMTGHATIFQGGCTTAGGTSYDGTATLQSDSAQHLELDAWTVTHDGHTSRFSGTADAPDTTAMLGTTANLTVDVDGVAVRSDLAYSCHALPGCDNECILQCTPEGSGVELVGDGGALVSGSWQYFAMASVHLDSEMITLRGADTLTATTDGYQIAP